MPRLVLRLLRPALLAVCLLASCFVLPASSASLAQPKAGKAARPGKQMQQLIGNFDYRLACEARQNNDFKTAIGSFNKALAVYPKNGVLWFDLGQCQLRAHLYPQAVGSLSNAVKFLKGKDERPLLANAYQLLGAAYYGANAFLQAIGSLNSSIKVAPSCKSYLLLGAVYSDMGQLPLAEQNFRLALGADSSDCTAHSSLADCLYKQNRLHDAVVAYEAAIACRPSYYCLLQKAVCLLKLGQTSRAIDVALPLYMQYNSSDGGKAGTLISALASSDSLRPFIISRVDDYSSSLVSAADTARLLTLKGSCFEEGHMLDSAFSCYARVFSLVPMMRTPVYALALAEKYRYAQMFSSAGKWGHMALSLDSSSWRANLFLAKNFIHSAPTLDSALFYSQKSVTLSNYSEPEALATLADVYAMQSRFDSAIAIYDRSLSADSARSDYSDALVNSLSKACVYHAMGRRADVDSILSKIAGSSGSPSSSAPEVCLLCYALAGTNSAALDSVSAILLSRSNISFVTRYNIACAYSLFGLPEKAVYFLRQAVESGFRAYNHMLRDVDLLPLHGRSDFDAVADLCRLRANSGLR